MLGTRMPERARVATAAAADTPVLSSSRKWTTVALLSLGMVIAYADRGNISVVLALEEFRNLFQLTDQMRGTLNSAFFWSYALLQIPAGWVVDKYGVKKPYAYSFLFWCLVSALTGATTAVWQIILLRVLLGFGEAIVTPASMRWIRLNVQEKERGLAVGIYMAGTKLGPAISAPMTAALVGAFGWRAMFLIVGIGGLAWLVPWMMLVRDNDRELEAAARVKSAAPDVPFARVLASPAVWGIVIGTFACNYFVYFCLTWLPSYFVERWGLSVNSMGWYTMFSFGGMAVMATLAGFAADRVIARGHDPVRVRKAFTITGLLLASTEIIGPLSGNPQVALFFAVFSLTGLGVTTANYWALTQTLIPGAAIGRIVGVQNMASNLAGIVAPLVTGWLLTRTGSYQAPMVAIMVVLMIGVTSYVTLVRRRFAPAQPATPVS
jgi:MFS transporter, ACS family, D-galactonate transporter